MIKKYVGYLAISSLLFIFIACGGGTISEGGPAGEDARLDLSPESTTITDATDTAQWHTEYFHVIVRDTFTDIPLSNVEIWVTYPWAAPDPGYAPFGTLVQFRDDEGNAVNSPMKVTTDEYGVAYIRIDFQSGGGVAYSGTLQVTSGGKVASAEFAVEASSE